MSVNGTKWNRGEAWGSSADGDTDRIAVERAGAKGT